MHAHFVLAHPEPQSYNAHLVRSGSEALEAEGWVVSVSDLYVGYEVLAPFVAYGVEAGLRYSDDPTVESRLRAVVADFRDSFPRLAERAPVPFNRMEEWGPDDRIAPTPQSTRRSYAESSASS
jgi:hypothetical protein